MQVSNYMEYAGSHSLCSYLITVHSCVGMCIWFRSFPIFLGVQRGYFGNLFFWSASHRGNLRNICNDWNRLDSLYSHIIKDE